MTFCETNKSEPAENEGEVKIPAHLVKEVGVHVRDAHIGPPSMNKEELREVPELAERVIRRHGCLRSLQPKETTANVGFLDHRDVIRAVPNRQRHRVSPFLHLEIDQWLGS